MRTAVASVDRYLDASHGLAVHPDDALPRFLSGPKGRQDEAHQLAGIWRVVFAVLLPFAAGYCLSYFYRTINALISHRLGEDLALSAADLGILTAVLFLTFALIQLPLGVWLDRYGPRPVQVVLLFIAAVGAAVFACAQSLVGLVIGRALIGVGVAGALMAGLKGLALWWPPERIALANGLLITLGTLGAVIATAPAELLMASIGWRGLFLLLAALTAASALLILCVVPHRPAPGKTASMVAGPTIRAIYRDARFWRLAPLSATSIGSAWALQGLWAAPWLADVEGLQRDDVVAHLLVMAIALSASALALGVAADQLRCRGVSLSTSFAFATGFALLAQLSLVMSWPVPTWLPWIAISGVGAATVLSYAILAELFPKSAAGRANGALNLLHIGSAFLVQVGIGFIVEFWPVETGRHPPIAYQTAFSLNLALQAAAFAWLVWPRQGTQVKEFSAHPVHALAATLRVSPAAAAPYLRGWQDWRSRQQIARQQANAWRLVALVSFAVAIAIGSSLAIPPKRDPASPHSSSSQLATSPAPDAAAAHITPQRMSVQLRQSHRKE
jgi:predicted MFS family arabinose efflux permease